MTKTKSPILIIENVLDAGEAMDIADGAFGIGDGELDDSGNFIPTKITSTAQEIAVGNAAIDSIVPLIEQHFGVVHKGIARPMFEWYPEGCHGEPRAENATFIEGKWVRTSTADFTCIIFLSDQWTQEDAEFAEMEFLSVGGALEFLNHKFSIRPQMGTAIVFPSDPRFMNAISKVSVGNAKLVRFNIVCEVPYVYDPQQFPGDYRTWF